MTADARFPFYASITFLKNTSMKLVVWGLNYLNETGKYTIVLWQWLRVEVRSSGH